MKTNIHEYCEEMEVEIVKLLPEDGVRHRKTMNERSYQGHTEARWVVKAQNEGGYNHTRVDLIDVIEWVKINKPELL